MSDVDLPRLVELAADQKNSSFFPKCSSPKSSDNLPKQESKSLNSSPQISKKYLCHKCSKRLNLTNRFQCKCSELFCTKHKYPDMHSCKYDFKSEWREQLEKKNPNATLPKIDKV